MIDEGDKIVERMAWLAYEGWRAWPNREAYVHQAIAQAAANTATAIEARVRAEVAEAVAQHYVGVPAADVDPEEEGHIRWSDLHAVILGRSSPDTTPDPA